MTWIARTGPRKKESGKFHSHAQLGTTKSTSAEYQGWQLEFVTHQTGSSVSRTRFSVSISDPNKNRVQYLRDFSSLQQATEAAQRWIDKTLSMSLAKPPAGIGTIPVLPATPAALANAAQEK